ncbi:hypothetical protein SAMN05421721_1085 [Ectothiorhodospira mobilis]|uniref:Uncharacterized protein n=1 Tax=Ectothiorhodospira mobilis TaxID=195064 RepID=A0A1I4RIC7_ECTMO|nr:hypothetical protein SAMN05421721_1085 [Ectothiorhodospira mobilis]
MRTDLLDPTNDGNILQMNLIELNKADHRVLPPYPPWPWISNRPEFV